MDHVKATPESPGRPAVPGASAKVEAELAKLRKGWEAAEHRGIDLKVELLQTQVEARTLRASLHGSEVAIRYCSPTNRASGRNAKRYMLSSCICQSRELSANSPASA